MKNIKIFLFLFYSFVFSLSMISMTSAKTYTKPSDSEIKEKLNKDQYKVTQKNGTEQAFKNKYWDNKEQGIYVDVVTGEPLFSSQNKFKSGTGWPSFTQPIDPKYIIKKPDNTLFSQRTEVKSKVGDSHLGHVFDDGPQDKGGKRYCMNSAAFDFIPLDLMKDKGYGQYLFSFKDAKGWKTANLAGGCFWGMEKLLGRLDGVIETQVGFAGGDLKKPTYNDVKTGKTGHAEAVQVLYDPDKLSFEKLLLEFFRIHDPTSLNQQGNDKGTQYRSAIFYENDAQKNTAQKVIQRVNESGDWGKDVVTELKPVHAFWRAEDEHQKYLNKNPNGYTCHLRRDYDFK